MDSGHLGALRVDLSDAEENVFFITKVLVLIHHRVKKAPQAPKNHIGRLGQVALTTFGNFGKGQS